MNDSSCSTENCQCAPADEQASPAIAKAQPQWQSRKTDDGAVVEIALPGVAKDDLELTTGSGFLKLTARRKATGEARLIQGTGAPGAYQLGLRLAANLDGGNANAKFEDGVLTVTLPLAESAKPRRIEVG
ncbi:MAG: hsp18 [Akkermansiaceae bacterium]|nr:hsp18 [Akkermansiaceae bacterium]